MTHPRRQKPRQKQAGFTLIEIAIVLVIIGLLLGGVLKGQELINSAKIKNLLQDFKAVPVMIYGYQDKFKALPGDDANYSRNLGAGANLVPTAATLGDGKLDGAYNSVTGTDETVAFWQHVRLAGLQSGTTDFSTVGSAVYRNAEGGRVGVQSAPPITGMNGAMFLCSDGLLGSVVRQIDVALDDGNTDKGSVQAALNPTAVWSAALAPVPTASINNNDKYVVCMSF